MAIDPTELNLTLNQIQQALNLLKAFQSAQHIMMQVAHAEVAVTDAESRKQQVEKNIDGLDAILEQRWEEHKGEVEKAWENQKALIARWEEDERVRYQESIDVWVQKIAELEATHTAAYQAYMSVANEERTEAQTHEAGKAARRDAIRQLEEQQQYCQAKAEEAYRAQQAAEDTHRQRMTDMQEEEQELQKQVDKLKNLLGVVAAKLQSE